MGLDKDSIGQCSGRGLTPHWKWDGMEDVGWAELKERAVIGQLG